MSLTHNEQVKLTATWMNGISIALIAVGFISPFVSAFNDPKDFLRLSLLLGSLGCLVLAAFLHLGARATLRRLRE